MLAMRCSVVLVLYVFVHVHAIFWDGNNIDLVFVAQGSTANLTCKVKGFYNGTIIWVRLADDVTLTNGNYVMHTSDKRITSLMHRLRGGTEKWTLQIKHTRPQDSGLYECRSTDGPTTLQYIHLEITEPITTIVEGPEVDAFNGTDVTFTCVVEGVTEAPAHVLWFKNSKVIGYDKPSHINIVTREAERRSRLTIVDLSEEDSGNYTCVPSNSGTASVVLNVSSVLPSSATGVVKLNRFLNVFFFVVNSFMLPVPFLYTVQ